MKIVWVVNMPLGPLAKKLNLTADSGAWLVAALEKAKAQELDLYVLTTCNIPEDITICEDGITYIALALGSPAEYRHTKDGQKRFEEIFDDIAPDVVQVWGTEYQHSLSAISAAKNAKKLVYIQGMMSSVYEHYLGGLSTKTLLKNTSMVELLMGKSIFDARKRTKRSAENEKEVLKRADAIITETEWSKAYCRYISGCNDFGLDLLPINEAFVNSNRTPEKVIPHTIFTPASNYPLKGGHNLIKAVALVEKSYPDVKLVIPGRPLERHPSIKQKLKTKCYQRYLTKLITELSMWDNIEFTGALTSKQMAEQMEKANVFVCSSKIENHSATLREAMFVGAPCISTCVGGIPEYLKNGENGEFYAFEDYKALAGKIEKLFSDGEYAEKLAKNARQTMLDYYEKNISDMNKIYEAL